MVIPNIEWIKKWVAEHGGGVDWDETPTEGSRKAVRSGGVFLWVSNLLSSLTLAWDKITNKPSSFSPSAHAASHGSSGADPIFVAQSQVAGLADALAAKRDKTDEGCYNATTRWVWSSDDPNCPDGWLEAANAPDAPQPYRDEYNTWFVDDISGYGMSTPANPYPDGENLEYIDFGFGPAPGYSGEFYARAARTSSVDPDPSHKLARRDADAASAIAKFDADGNLVADNSGKGLSKNDYTDADKAEVAKVNDKADEFTKWIYSGFVEYGFREVKVEFDHDLELWFLYVREDEFSDFTYTGYFNESPEDAVSLSGFTDALETNYNITATRKRVLRTGEAATPADLELKRDINDLDYDLYDPWTIAPPGSIYEIIYNKQLKRYEWTIKDGPGAGEVDHTEASNADDKTRLEFLGEVATRSKHGTQLLVGGLSTAGVPTDPNVRDLFSESNTSLKGVIAAKTATVATSATAPTSVTLADNDCKTVTMGTATALQIDFGAAKQTGALRLCELVIADAPSTALTLSFPSGHTFHSSMSTGKWYTTETGRNHFFFEETATNVWTVTRQVETSDTPTTTHTEGGAE